MQYRIETLPEIKLAGEHVRMSFANNKTGELWRAFMPRRREIGNTVGTELYSVEIYPRGYFETFNPSADFEKWAAVPVKDLDKLPEGMESLTIPEGLYAVFTYKGRASEGAKAYEYIFRTWLPESEYVLDNRPHFALMGEKYKNDDPDSEEELWVPIKRKA